MIRVKTYMVLLGVCVSIPAPWVASARKRLVSRVYTVPNEEQGSLQAINAQGQALFLRYGQAQAAPTLVLWDIRKRSLVSEIPLPGWAQWAAEGPQQILTFDCFKFQRDGRRLTVLESPSLAVIDLTKQAETRRVLPSRSYLDPKTGDGPYPSDDYPRAAMMARNPRNDSVAVAFNIGKQTDLFVYDSDLSTRLGHWSLVRYVRDLAWSPDGNTLAILYAARYDEGRVPISVYFSKISPEPDVWLLDVQSGEVKAKFSTGSNENQIAFSHDGTQLYTIDTYFYGEWIKPRGAIRVFSLPSGALVRTISAGPKGIRNRFTLSPGDRFIVADASTSPPFSFQELNSMEPNYTDKISRIVVMDAQSGRLLFQHHEFTYWSQVWQPVVFLLSPDGGELLVQFGMTRDHPNGRVEVFSVDASAGRLTCSADDGFWGQGSISQAWCPVKVLASTAPNVEGSCRQ